MNIDKFKNRKSKRDPSKVQEEKAAKRIGGRKTFASGALPFDKGDAVNRRLKLRLECKRTDKESLSIKRTWLTKLKGNLVRGEIPVVNIEIQDEGWYLIRPEEFAFILERLEEQ
jgi:hypothetical protein